MIYKDVWVGSGPPPHTNNPNEQIIFWIDTSSMPYRLFVFCGIDDTNESPWWELTIWDNGKISNQLDFEPIHGMLWINPQEKTIKRYNKYLDIWVKEFDIEFCFKYLNN